MTRPLLWKLYYCLYIRNLLLKFVGSFILHRLQPINSDYRPMKTKPKICTAKCEYLLPDVEFADIIIERGFAVSGEIEEVGKDDEVEF